MSNDNQLYGIWFKTFGGWLCDGLGHPFTTYSLGEAVVRLLVVKAQYNTERVLSSISGDAFMAVEAIAFDNEKLVIRSFDEWAESEGLIE